MNNIKPEMSRALIKMAGVMKKDYQRFLERPLKGEAGSKGEPMSDFAQERLEGFMESLEFNSGSKYIKVVRNDGQRMVWGFIVNTETDKKFKYGDILMAAGWAAPARNKARGNIFEDLSWVNWTGPAYL